MIVAAVPPFCFSFIFYFHNKFIFDTLHQHLLKASLCMLNLEQVEVLKDHRPFHNVIHFVYQHVNICVYKTLNTSDGFTCLCMGCKPVAEESRKTCVAQA